MTQIKVGQKIVKADARNLNVGLWKALICDRCKSIIHSTGAKARNAIKEKLNFVLREGIATAPNTVHGSLPWASNLTSKY